MAERVVYRVIAYGEWTRPSPRECPVTLPKFWKKNREIQEAHPGQTPILDHGVTAGG
jgi:hypothetical protein